MSWLLQAAAPRALAQGQTPARHRVDSVDTIHCLYTIHTIHSLYTDIVSMVTSHGHILQCYTTLQLLLTSQPGEWIDYECLVTYLSYRDVNQSIDSYHGQWKL